MESAARLHRSRIVMHKWHNLRVSMRRPLKSSVVLVTKKKYLSTSASFLHLSTNTTGESNKPSGAKLSLDVPVLYSCWLSRPYLNFAVAASSHTASYIHVPRGPPVRSPRLATLVLAIPVIIFMLRQSLRPARPTGFVLHGPELVQQLHPLHWAALSRRASVIF